ncbi:MAG: hypothetical protein IKO19_02045 [Candidatus Riflebacteria bacterium]|nr:hypothetical protein [Candidatus Riflebacteria bacterium]
MKFLRFVWKLFVMAAVFGVGYVVGREHSFEEEEQWEAENRKNNENNDKTECSSCTEKNCDTCKEAPKAEEKPECAACTDKNCAECKGENGVTFEYENEKASKVAVVGNFNNWNKDADPMVKENNTWKCTKALEAGTYEYQFVVDDTDWVVDPKAETTVKNKYEGYNSVVVVK